MVEKPVIGLAPIDEALGPFDDHTFLGIGSFGETYRVRKNGEDFAVKIIHAAGLPDYVFAREVEALRRISHPNVMGFIDSGSIDADGALYPYLRCEFIPGESVFQKRESGELPPSAEAVEEMLSGLLLAVREIHARSILHRDISSRNVMLRNGDWHTPVLLDFGLARVLDMSGHSLYPQQIGTFRYMAPEQLEGKPPGTRSDLYAVGSVVYEAATGVHPYDVDSHPTTALLLKHMEEGPPADPRQLCTVFNDETANLVLRLLSVEGFRRLTVSRALKDLGHE